MQINIGKLCNQTCSHCHVDAGPHRKKENMESKTVERILDLIDQQKTIKTVDITGGAPELNPHFRSLVATLRKKNIEVIDRCNLTVMFEKGQEDLASFLADHKVHIVASLPCYSRENVDKQRGDGVFGKSIKALQQLNLKGYGKGQSGLVLDLVFNPIGPKLPPNQEVLKADYEKRLFEDFGIHFDNLFTVTNMPIKRFLVDLRRSKSEEAYMELLRNAFNPQAAENVMCKDTISISWDGFIFDCDFNQMLDMNCLIKKPDIWSISSFDDLTDNPINLADHCFGCTAGSGSSCTGSLTK